MKTRRREAISGAGREQQGRSFHRGEICVAAAPCRRVAHAPVDVDISLRAIDAIHRNQIAGAACCLKSCQTMHSIRRAVLVAGDGGQRKNIAPGINRQDGGDVTAHRINNHRGVGQRRQQIPARRAANRRRMNRLALLGSGIEIVDDLRTQRAE